MSLSSQLRKNALFLLTLVAVFVGVILGLLLRSQSYPANSLQRRLIHFPGEIFLRGIKFIIVPLISSSLITGIAGDKVAKTGAIARRTLVFFFITTLAAVLLGTVLVLIIGPGKLNRDFVVDKNGNNSIGANSSLPSTAAATPKLSGWDTFMDVIRNIVPDNIVEMCFQIYRSKIEIKRKNDLVIDYVVSGYSRGINILGLALFSSIFGVVLASLGRRGKPMLEFFSILNEISIKIISNFMWFSPIGVCSLVCYAIIDMEDPVLVLTKILFYLLTVCFGFLIHGVLILPLMFVLITRQNILKFSRDMIEVFLLAFATASSSATLPTLIICIEEKAKYPKSVSRVVLPCGIIVNKDGTALYYVVATTFLAQLNQIELGFIDFVINGCISLLISTGGSGAPGGHMVNSILLLSLLGIPADQISLLIALDWIVDRIMTVINCWSDCVVCGIVYHLSKQDIEKEEVAQQDETENQALTSPHDDDTVKMRM